MKTFRTLVALVAAAAFVGAVAVPAANATDMSGFQAGLLKSTGAGITRDGNHISGLRGRGRIRMPAAYPWTMTVDTGSRAFLFFNCENRGPNDVGSIGFTNKGPAMGTCAAPTPEQISFNDVIARRMTQMRVHRTREAYKKVAAVLNRHLRKHGHKMSTVFRPDHMRLDIYGGEFSQKPGCVSRTQMTGFTYYTNGKLTMTFCGAPPFVTQL